MEDIEEIFEAQIAIIGIAFFLLFASLGTLLTSLNPDSYLYIEFDPPLDFYLILSILLVDLFCLGLFLNQTLEYRHTRNLERRKGELLYLVTKLRIWGVLFVLFQGFLFYFWLKYFSSEFAFYLSFFLLLVVLMISLFFYNAINLKSDING
ncbi:MAG: hypothetical protein ACOC35_04180 [Promethearchaeia archaeon]